MWAFDQKPLSFFYTTLGIGEKESFFGYKFFYCMSQETIAHITLQVKGCQYVERFVFIINALFTYSSGCECEELTIQNWKYVCYMKYVFNLLSNDVAFFAEGIIEMWPFCTTRFTYFHRFIWLGLDWNFFQVSRFSIRWAVEVLCYWRRWIVFMKSWFGTILLEKHKSKIELSLCTFNWCTVF